MPTIVPKVPLDDRLDFYRYIVASQNMDQALAALAIIESKGDFRTFEQTDLSNEVVLLWSGFFTLYGKPFKQSWDKKLGRGLKILPDIIPPEFQDLHKRLLDLRDKMYSHTDLEFEPGKLPGRNHLGVRVGMNGKPAFGISYQFPDTILPKIREMVEGVRNETLERAQRLWKKWQADINVVPGHFFINISDDRLLIRITSSNRLPKS